MELSPDGSGSAGFRLRPFSFPSKMWPALGRWHGSGAWARYFDNPADGDDLHFQDWQVIDMAGAAEHEDLCEAALFYLLERLRLALENPDETARVKLMVVDEAWRYLQDPAVLSYLAEAAKTWRKKNAALIMATQSAVDVTGKTQAQQGNTFGLLTGGIHAAITAVIGTVMFLFVVLMLLLLAAVTYAQVIWAQIALAILIILGPIFMPFLVFDPLSFLFWGWFRAMITYSLYAVITGAVLRVFSAVGISYITTLGNANLDMQSLTDVGLWGLAVVPLFIAGILASLKCGELASMLVTSTGAAGSGLMGMAATAGTVAATGGAAAAAKAGAGGIR